MMNGNINCKDVHASPLENKKLGEHRLLPCLITECSFNSLEPVAKSGKA